MKFMFLFHAELDALPDLETQPEPAADGNGTHGDAEDMPTAWVTIPGQQRGEMQASSGE